MDFACFKQAVIARCQELGIEEYELYYTQSESTSVEIFQHEIKEFTASTEGGVCFRAIVGGKMGYASTQALNAEEAKAVVDKAVDNAAFLESEEQVFLAEGGQTYQQTTTESLPIPTTEHLIARSLEVQDQIYASSEAVIDGCMTNAIVEKGSTAIYNSKGLDLHSDNTLTAWVMASVVTDGKEMADEYTIKLGDLDKIDTKAAIAKATASALQKLGGDVAPTGQYPVVFHPEAMTSLLGVFSSIFSSENAQKGLSKLQGKEGTKIASDLVTIVDDPFYPGSLMQHSFDAEGSPTRTKSLVEKGQFKTLLYNLKTAAVAGVQTTGNASKGAYNAPVAVQPFTMYIVPGQVSEEDMLASIEKGVYITDLGGLHAGANPISGDFSLQSSGYMIENGRKTDFVKSFTVAGNFYELLLNIKALASNLETPGMGRFGSPSVLVEGLSVAGK